MFGGRQIRSLLPVATAHMATGNRQLATSFAILIVAAVLSSGCRKKEARDPENLNLANKVEQREVTLFFESPDLVLVPETRMLELPQSEAAALSAVLRELLKGSANAAVAPVFPQDSELRASYLLPDGTAIVDLGGPTLSNGWNTGSHSEMMAIYSIVQTLATNFAAVRQVRLVLNGQPVETLAGHVRIDRPLRPLRHLVQH